MELLTVSTVEEARDLLRTWREDNVRRSDDVVDLWEAFTRDSTQQLGEEKWMILEQVAVAAMDLHRMDIVDETLSELRKAFDVESFRVRRLIAMKAEMQEDYDKAAKILDTILDEDEANNQAKKRKIAMIKARGGEAARGAAISNLVNYLKDFMNDAEAWLELCELYILEQDYAKAAFCCEELILQNPHNHIYYQRYAEIKYTQGGYEHLEMAKTYYSHAIKLNPNNMRALYGLLQTSVQLSSSPKCPAPKKKEYVKTVMWASKQITKRYEEKQGPQANDISIGLLDGLIGQLQIQAPQNA